MNRRISGSDCNDESVVDFDNGSSNSSSADTVLNISPDAKSYIVWAGVLSQKPEKRLDEFQMDAHYALLFVNKGTLRVIVDDKPFTVLQDQALLIWPQEKCIGVEPNAANLRCQWLSFYIDQSPRLDIQGLIQVPRVSTAKNPMLFAELFSILTNEYHANQPYGPEYEALSTQGSHHLLLSLLSRLSPSASEAPLIVSNSLIVVAERATDYIRENLSNRIATIDLAQELECSEGYIRRAFRKVYGCSISDHILEVRMYNARALLATTRISISEVAQHSGFSRLSYFTRVFTRAHGVTPSKYRANHSRQHVVPGI